MMKKLKCVGLVMGKDGVFRSEEFPGPPTYKHWEGSFEIMENGYLLTKISDLGNMRYTTAGSIITMIFMAPNSGP